MLADRGSWAQVLAFYHQAIPLTLNHSPDIHIGTSVIGQVTSLHTSSITWWILFSTSSSAFISSVRDSGSSNPSHSFSYKRTQLLNVWDYTVFTFARLLRARLSTNINAVTFGNHLAPHECRIQVETRYPFHVHPKMSNTYAWAKGRVNGA